MYMAVLRGGFSGVLESVITASWRETHCGGVGGTGGEGWLGSEGAADLRFVVLRAPVTGTGVLGCAPCEMPKDGAVLRLDEVVFPVGAVAHRHHHTGSGWRYLVRGALRIEAEAGATVMQAGDSWFEPAQTAVRAVAQHEAGVTRFVRCMVIPLADAGRSTFRLEDAGDVDLPRLQKTHRHFDHRVQVDVG